MILIELFFGLMLAAMVLLVLPFLLLMAGIAGAVLLWVLAPAALVALLIFWLVFPGMNSLARRKYTMYVVETMISTQPTTFCLPIKACFPGAPLR